MYIISNDKILNTCRIAFLEIDKDTPSEVNYFFEDGEVYKEKFHSTDGKTAETAAKERFEEFGAKDTTFIKTSSNELINPRYIKKVKRDILNPLKVVYELYNAKPVKEKLASKEAVTTRIKEVKDLLEKIKGTAPEKEQNYLTLQNLPSINGVQLKGNKTLEELGAQAKGDYSLSAESGNALEMTMDGSNYVVTLKLKNKAGTVISTQTIDLPLEAMVTDVKYNNGKKELTITLKNGQTTTVPVSALVSGLVSQSAFDTKTNATNADLAKFKTEVYKKAETYGKAETYAKSEVYNKGEVDAKTNGITSNLNGFKNEVYKKTETYGKTEVYNKTESYGKTEVYNKSEIDKKVQELETKIQALKPQV